MISSDNVFPISVYILLYILLVLIFRYFLRKLKFSTTTSFDAFIYSLASTGGAAGLYAIGLLFHYLYLHYTTPPNDFFDGSFLLIAFQIFLVSLLGVSILAFLISYGFELFKQHQKRNR